MITPTALAVSGAATVWVHARLALPSRPVRVLHGGQDAVYVDDGGVCLGLLSRVAVAVPCGVRTILDELPEVGDEAVIGDGRFCVPGLEVTVSRFVDASVGRVDAVPPITVSSDELPAPALALLSQGDPRAVGLLLGRGSGLTPVGDDVLCGWLAARHAIGEPVEPVASEVRRLAPVRTTVLSATLLECASRGEVIPQLREVLDSRSGLDPLLAVGHTSGVGLALGMSLAG